MSKKTKAAAKALTVKAQAIVSTAAAIGFAASGAFENAVALCIEAKRCIPKGADPLKSRVMIELGVAYQSGYVARRLLSIPAYAKRWHNMSDAQMCEAALEIMAKPEPESTKPNRRTEEEHRAVRAASSSFSTARKRAGIVSSRAGAGGKKRRAPRPASNDPTPVNAIFASPKLANDNEAREHFRSAFAALLTTTEVNQQPGAKKEVKHVAFIVQSIIADAKAQIERALA